LTHFHMRFFFGIVLAAALAVPATAQDATSRGRYLAVLGDCAGCHTVAHGPAYAGGLPFNTPFGTIYSTNLTPDRETGIGGWTGDQFYRALHDGVAPGGRHLYPALPYAYFTRLTRQDTSNLFVYLKTLKPVHQPPTPNKLTFPFNLRLGLVFWNALYLDKTAPKVPADASPEWKRGEYLVNGLGHCAACHTPKTILFGDDTSRPLAGGVVDNWFANNLAGGAAEGLGTWSHDDVVRFLATGVSAHATAAGSMLEKVTSSTSKMTPQDRNAIATYLKSLPAQAASAAEKPRQEQMERGKGIFTAYCQSCHAVPSDKAANGYPDLAGDTLVMGRDPTTVLRIVLTGGTAPTTPGRAPVKPMPAFNNLDDGQIADVSSYIRNDWGNAASPVSATQVHNLRRALKN
jgi:mono/diheme cytochrome c family protein